MDWFKKEQFILAYDKIDSAVNELCNKYNTNIILTGFKQVLRDEIYTLEVWVNLNSGKHLINIYHHAEADNADIN